MSRQSSGSKSTQPPTSKHPKEPSGRFNHAMCKPSVSSRSAPVSQRKRPSRAEAGRAPKSTKTTEQAANKKHSAPRPAGRLFFFLPSCRCFTGAFFCRHGQSVCVQLYTGRCISSSQFQAAMGATSRSQNMARHMLPCCRSVLHLLSSWRRSHHTAGADSCAVVHCARSQTAVCRDRHKGDG